MLKINSLGATKLPVTCLGYGSMGLRGPATWGVRTVTDEDADKFLNQVLDEGINFIDTSPDYGASEERIGKYIGSRRSEFFLATKCGCDYQQHTDHIEIIHTWSAEVLKRNIETSLTRLQTDCIDLLQFHGGDAESIQQAGLVDTLIEFREQGIIRFLGSSSSIPNLQGMIDMGVFDTFQIPYSCLAPQHHELISRAAATGAGIIIRGGIAHGGPDAVIERPAITHQARLDELLPTGMTRAELILRFTLSHPNVDTVIAGTCNSKHLQENIASAAAGPLSDDLYSEIKQRVM